MRSAAAASQRVWRAALLQHPLAPPSRTLPAGRLPGAPCGDAGSALNVARGYAHGAALSASPARRAGRAPVGLLTQRARQRQERAGQREEEQRRPQPRQQEPPPNCQGHAAARQQSPGAAPLLTRAALEAADASTTDALIGHLSSDPTFAAVAAAAGDACRSASETPAVPPKPHLLVSCAACCTPAARLLRGRLRGRLRICCVRASPPRPFARVPSLAAWGWAVAALIPLTLGLTGWRCPHTAHHAARDEQDAEKLAAGIQLAREKGVLGSAEPAPYTTVDVLGTTPDERVGRSPFCFPTLGTCARRHPAATPMFAAQLLSWQCFPYGAAIPAVTQLSPALNHRSAPGTATHGNPSQPTATLHHHTTLQPTPPHPTQPHPNHKPLHHLAAGGHDDRAAGGCL